MSSGLETLSVETPERVELSLDVAGMGTRAIAYLVDFFVLFGFWTVVTFVASLFTVLSLDDFNALSSALKALSVFAVFFVQWGYWVLLETVWRGQSVGKRALKIRVVRSDGSPVTFFDSALRNLARAVDFLPALYGVGLTCMAIDAKSRRLGDLLAGTVLVRERAIDLAKYETAPSAPRAAAALTAEEFELVTGFLARAQALAPEARGRVALKVAEPFAARLSAEQSAKALASGEAAETFLSSLVQKDG